MISRLFISLVTQIDSIDQIIQHQIKSLSRILYSFEYFNEGLILLIILVTLICYIHQNPNPNRDTKISNSKDQYLITISWILTCIIGFISAISLQVIGFWLLYVYYFPHYDQNGDLIVNTINDVPWITPVLQQAIKESLIFPVNKYIIYLLAHWIAIILYKFLSSHSSSMIHRISSALVFYMTRRMIRFQSWDDPIKCIILISLIIFLSLPRISIYRYLSTGFVTSAIILLFCLYPSTIWTWLKPDFGSATMFYLIFMPWHWNYDRHSCNETRYIWILFAEWIMLDVIELGYAMTFIKLKDYNLSLFKD